MFYMFPEIDLSLLRVLSVIVFSLVLLFSFLVGSLKTNLSLFSVLSTLSFIYLTYHKVLLLHYLNKKDKKVIHNDGFYIFMQCF